MKVQAAPVSALAFAATAVLPTASSAAALTMTSAWILYFFSGLFVREDNIPDTLRKIAGVVRVKPLFEALVIAYDPATSAAGLVWTNIGCSSSGVSAASSLDCASSAGHPPTGSATPRHTDKNKSSWPPVAGSRGVSRDECRAQIRRSSPTVRCDAFERPRGMPAEAASTTGGEPLTRTSRAGCCGCEIGLSTCRQSTASGPGLVGLAPHTPASDELGRSKPRSRAHRSSAMVATSSTSGTTAAAPVSRRSNVFT
jgi:hypothetical protein